ncbi:MAG TPA: NUDIX hydrolase [Thermoleophilia bacterium]|nr:NUDIX hydrolase [Thermoleophilia bacterium]
MKYCPECAGSFAEEMVHGKLRPVCKLCGFVFYQGPKLAAGVVVVDGDKVLLHRRDVGPREGTWTFPSGYVDLGESPGEAALREAREETSLDVVLDQLLGVYTNLSHSVSLVMYAGHLAEGATPGREDEQVGLFPLEGLPELAFDHDRQILDDWRRLAAGKPKA